MNIYNNHCNVSMPVKQSKKSVKVFESWKRWVFNWRRKVCSGDDETTASGRPFQTWAAANRTVDSLMGGMTRRLVRRTYWPQSSLTRYRSATATRCPKYRGVRWAMLHFLQLRRISSNTETILLLVDLNSHCSVGCNFNPTRYSLIMRYFFYRLRCKKCDIVIVMVHYLNLNIWGSICAGFYTPDPAYDLEQLLFIIV